jgi:hypothetical protein
MEILLLLGSTSIVRVINTYFQNPLLVLSMSAEGFSTVVLRGPSLSSPTKAEPLRTGFPDRDFATKPRP